MHETMGGQARITILMGVYNGAAFLPDQLRSLQAQTYPHWRLVVSDDSPGEDSADVIRRLVPDVEIRRGPGLGFSVNYMSMIRTLPEAPGFVALADQDDVWVPEKLARAMATLEGIDGPALYCARVTYWDGTSRRPGPAYRRTPSFRNALVQNIAQGNTIVLNEAAALLARRASQSVEAVFAHDWWLYLLITGAGGTALMDNGPPVLLYRQHAYNQIGSGAGLRAQAVRKRAVLSGALSDRLGSNISALDSHFDTLTPIARKQLGAFKQAREARGLRRVAHLARLRPYRQSWMGDVGFWGAALLGRI